MLYFTSSGIISHTIMPTEDSHAYVCKYVVFIACICLGKEVKSVPLLPDPKFGRGDSMGGGPGGPAPYGMWNLSEIFRIHAVWF